MTPIATSSLIPWVVVALLVGRLYTRRFRVLPLPPGPPSLPALGNIHHFTLENAWLRFTELAKQFGAMTMFHGLGNHVLILNSEEAIRELFEKRYSIYSDRPRMVMIGELAGTGRQLPLIQYGQSWRNQRKVARAALGTDAVSAAHLLIEEAALYLCKRISETPEDFFAHIKLTTGRIILPLIYGIMPESAENEFIRDVEETMEFGTINAVPGKNLCDMFPWMVYLPSWLPFHKRGRQGREICDRSIYKPYEYVKQQMAAGTAMPSVTQRLIEKSQYRMTSEWEEAIQRCTSSMYAAGSETMYATILVFIVAMILHPEIQARAQAELDAVVGPHRLPSISEDMDQLPYITALVKETMRWHPVVPLGMPRCLREEDTYAGYLLPKGTVLIPNVWALSREENLKYPPDDFIPERFLDSRQPVTDPSSYVFGFGRRICPGKLLAEKTVFIVICHLLALFTIEKDINRPFTPSFRPNGLTSFPSPFSCRFKPRRVVE